MWGALSDERTDLSFTIASGLCQCSHSRVRVSWDSRPYFTFSDSRLPFSSPPRTCRATGEVFDPACTRDTLTTTPNWLSIPVISYILSARTTHRKHMSRDRYALLWYDVIAHVQAARTQTKHYCCIIGRVCVAGISLAMDLHVIILIIVCCDKTNRTWSYRLHRQTIPLY
jgi:hypothetical protein